MRRYTAIHTPFGALYITAENDRIVKISPQKPSVAASLRRDSLPVLTQTADNLRQYLDGNVRSVTADFRGCFSPFQEELFHHIRRIPYGKAESSQQVASALGKPYAVKAVEAMCRTNPFWIAIPCHRVMLLSENDHSDKPLAPTAVLRRLEARYVGTLDKASKA